ncbi:hypothetical protein PV326_009303 [Microctonus aethiopoides]|nr:hypothetical protein PV326_009303 [Microctonus aethiopoides]
MTEERQTVAKRRGITGVLVGWSSEINFGLKLKRPTLFASTTSLQDLASSSSSPSPSSSSSSSLRGSDELLSQSGAVNNGASMSPQPHHATDNNNDAKKQLF